MKNSNEKIFLSFLPYVRILRLGVVVMTWAVVAKGAAATFTPLTPVSMPRIISNSPAYPGGGLEITNLIDGDPKTEYASDSKGTNTSVEFDFGAPVRIGAFRHLDRNDRATIASSELIFLDGSGGMVASVPVAHVNQRQGQTFFVLPSPVVAQRVKWHVTKLGPGAYNAVGGAEISFFSAEAVESIPQRDRIEGRMLPFLEKEGQPITIQLFRCATRLAQRTGVPIDSAMISDVPGYTWGTVSAMAQAGIKYFSAAPNYFDRIGTIMREWENKPFYWVGPDGQSKVLVWIPFWGYAMSHIYNSMSLKLVDDFCAGLEQRGYPYDIAYVRWSGHGDNAVPDPAICDFVKDWNAKYSSPKFIIAGVSEAFSALERRYGDQLPVVRGDWTPYWEDGAGSSARETGMNRQSSDRLVQAEALFAMRNPTAYPAGAFDAAWKNVLLYSEHTWGAWCSISEPERKETGEQWAIKKSYAEQADKQSRELLEQALQTNATAPGSSSTLEVINTLSWPRTELVTAPAALSAAGSRVVDDRGRPVPSQRLGSGELVLLARELPPFASKRYSLKTGSPYAENRATVKGAVLDSGSLRVRVDVKTGGIVELTSKGLKGNFADTSEGEAVNDYLYLPGDDLKDLQRNGPVTISAGENGPLVASLIIESEAPGCHKLRRELRVVAGQDYVELINLVDKARLQAKNYHAKEGKESVNFAFPFKVPDGELLFDVPLGAMHPEAEQMPSACKNWLTVGRWADVSNRERGVTWVTLDAPLIEVGGLTARLLNSQTNPDVWRKKIDRTQRFYSWAMNNHWGTNYRAYQEGPTVFRFILRPHRKSGPAEASRFAMGFSQPLLPRSAGVNPMPPLLRVGPADVLVSALKPSDDGKAWIVRLFGASGKTELATLEWGKGVPKAVFLSDTSEQPGQRMTGNVVVPGYGLVTLRAEIE
jgi:hypothetical protein